MDVYIMKFIILIYKYKSGRLNLQGKSVNRAYLGMKG